MTTEAAFKRYPYFLYPQAMALKEAIASADDTPRRSVLAGRVACMLGDTLALRSLAGLDPEEFACFYPDQANPELSTFETISDFLQTFGRGGQGASAQVSNEVAVVPVAPAVDYVSMLDRLEEEADAPLPEQSAPDSTATAIDAFLASQPAAGAELQNSAAEQRSEGVSSPETPVRKIDEKTAREMIKGGEYAEALDILTKLQLRDPENPCHADRIRYLRKLISLSPKSTDN